MTLKRRIYLNFVLLVVIFAVVGSILGSFLIGRTAVDEAQRSVGLNLRSAWSVIQSEFEALRTLVSVLGTGERVAMAYFGQDPSVCRSSLEAVRRQCGLDFLSLTDQHGRVVLRTLDPYNVGDDLSLDPFVKAALKGNATSGFASLSAQRLRAEGGDLEERAFVAFEPTAMAKPRAKGFETSGIAMIAAAPARDERGSVIGAIYAGVLVNRNNSLVDRIRSSVFEEKLYRGKPLGTVTVFQWDVRIATNVTLPNGNRAIGTRVSADVYDKVLENQLSWCDRAFVVDDWYISAYDPIHDVEGKPIGILYVGVLARKYDEMRRDLWKLYGALSLITAVLVLGIKVLFAKGLSGSITRLAQAAARIATGDYTLRVPEPSSRDEVLELTRAFNAMADSLRDREERLRHANIELERANESLQGLNSNYLDMLGFISHELKNTLGVIFTSARALEKGLAGPLGDPQATLVQGISKSIQSAISMTRNYLDLARIEQGEMVMEVQAIEFVEEVLRSVVEELGSAARQKNMALQEKFQSPIPLRGDAALMKVVVRNLLGNAIQYGRMGGKILLEAATEGETVSLKVWNEGEGLSKQQLDRLFGKFVRFPSEKGPDTRGTGLGLFITKEIVERHGGEIKAESLQGEWMLFTVKLPCSGPTRKGEPA